MTPAVKFSIVTPAFNSKKFLRETIESVISQAGDFSIEYFIMDGGSTDGTQEAVQHYQTLLLENSYPILCNEVVIHWCSERDEGMYDAINKGFRKASGDIYAWINSDDIYLPGAFNTIASAFAKYPGIDWLKGITSYITSNSTIYKAGRCFLYSQELIAEGIYGRIGYYFIQQDSVFWRKNLWNKVSGIDPSLKLAGDYYLWIAFARYAPLVSVNAYVSCFRKVETQLSSNVSTYQKEMDKICPPRYRMEKLRRQFFPYERLVPAWLRPFIYRALFGRHTYRAISVSSSAEYLLIEGDYYAVSGGLL